MSYDLSKQFFSEQRLAANRTDRDASDSLPLDLDGPRTVALPTASCHIGIQTHFYPVCLWIRQHTASRAEPASAVRCAMQRVRLDECNSAGAIQRILPSGHRPEKSHESQERPKCLADTSHELSRSVDYEAQETGSYSTPFSRARVIETKGSSK